MPPISPHLLRVYRRLDATRLAETEPGTADGLADDPELGLAPDRPRVLLAFETYSQQGLERALRSYGALERMEARGVGPLEVRLTLDDPYHPKIVLWSQKFHAPVLDVQLSRTRGSELGLFKAMADMPVLFVDGITLQHPGREFDWRRPPLPGQTHPGLSLSREVLELLLLMAQRIGAGAMALVPMSFHAAWVYDRYFRFVDGTRQGHFLSLRRDPALRPLWLLAWAVELGCVHGVGEREPYVWRPGPMVAPLSEPVTRYFQRRGWRADVRAALERTFEFDLPGLQERFPWSRMPDGPPPEEVAELLAFDPLAT